MANSMFRRVAQEAFPVVTEVWNSFLDEGNEDVDDCELYLYVTEYGNWVIDHAQYFTSWSSVITMAPISGYRSYYELQQELEYNEVEDNAAQ